jgi:glutathione S-transferase
MKLYDTPRAPNPRRVRIFFAEKGFVPDEVVTVDIMKLEHKARDARAAMPFQRVPTLVLDDGTVLSESIAICRYVEEALKPEPNLFGRDAKERALIEMWQRFAELFLFLQIAQAFRHLHPAMADMETPQVPAWGEANKTRAVESLALLDRELGARPYLAGGRFTVADITALVAVDFMRPMKWRIPEELGHVKRWHADVSSRPSAVP